MAIDYSALKFGKGTPRARLKQQRTQARETADERESAKVRIRSKGQCEVIVKGVRCRRRAFEVHHHQGGIGVRGRGESALAKNKSHCCTPHHTQITARTLRHVQGNAYQEVA